MRDLMEQGPKAYRYVALKAVHNTIPFIATVLAILGQPLFAIVIVLCQIGTGVITDLSFFSALKESNGGVP